MTSHLRRRDLAYLLPFASMLGSCTKDTAARATRVLDDTLQHTVVSAWNVDIPRAGIEALIKQEAAKRNAAVEVRVTGAPSKVNIGTYGGVMVQAEGITHSGKEYWRIRTLPSSDTPHLLLTFVEEFTPSVSRSKPLNVVAFSPTINDPAREYESSKVISEVPLPTETLSRLQSIHDAFSPYGTSTTPVYLVNYQSKNTTRTTRSAEYDPAQRCVLASSNQFTDPFFADEGEMNITHELAHAIAHNHRLNTPAGRQLSTLVTKYNTWMAAVHHVPSVQQVQLFDESSYDKTPDELDYGHPYDNYSELFASTVAIMRNRAPRFIQRYATLSASQQTQAREVGRAVLNILDALTYSRKHIDALIPEHVALRSTLAMGPLPDYPEKRDVQFRQEYQRQQTQQRTQ